MSNNILQVKNLTKIYYLDKVPVEALKGIYLDIKEGDFVSITGPSGAGKSTLLHIVGLLDLPTTGNIILGNSDVSNLNEKQLAELRLKFVGFVFQFFNLFCELTALENVMLPMMMAGHTPIESQEKAKELLKEVKLGGRLNHKPSELSGGQQQRVAIARSLINNPKILLADEPTGNLDSKTADEVFNLLQRLNQKGQTIIFITHEELLAKKASRIIRLFDGKIAF